MSVHIVIFTFEIFLNKKLEVFHPSSSVYFHKRWSSDV